MRVEAPGKGTVLILITLQSKNHKTLFEEFKIKILNANFSIYLSTSPPLTQDSLSSVFVAQWCSGTLEILRQGFELGTAG